MKDIICSIGPVSYDKKILREFVENGMTWVRLNFAHGSYAEYEDVIKSIKDLEKEFGVDITIMQDLQGPKIRLGLISLSSINVEKDEKIIFDTRIKESINAPTKILPVQYENFAKDLKIGELVYIDDGQLKLEVVDVIDEFSVECLAMNSWVVKSNKGINLPHTHITCSAISDKDKRDLIAGLNMGVEVVSLSFVRNASDLKDLRGLIEGNRLDVDKIKIMAKIERPEAMQNLDEILELADCVMIARGDLGVEIGFENLGKAQKLITEKAISMGKEVFPATDFLKHMLNSPTPSRSEVVDIYNALLDGVDGILLSNETSVGKYPVESCAMVSKIIKSFE